MGSLFVIVRDSGSFLGNPWPQNTSSEHPKNNPPPRLPPKWTPRCTSGLQDVRKMAQARPKAQKNIKNDVGNDPKATQSESLDKKHPDRRHRPQGLFNKCPTSFANHIPKVCDCRIVLQPSMAEGSRTLPLQSRPSANIHALI